MKYRDQSREEKKKKTKEYQAVCECDRDKV